MICIVQTVYTKLKKGRRLNSYYLVKRKPQNLYLTMSSDGGLTALNKTKLLLDRGYKARSRY